MLLIMCTGATVSLPSVVRTSALLTFEILTQTPVSDLAEALMQLPTTERLVLSLLYFNELTTVEIAEVMNTSPQFVLGLHAEAVSRLCDLLGLDKNETVYL